MSDSCNQTVAGELLLNEPMSRHTSWRTGGPADVYYRAASQHDLASFVRQRYEQSASLDNDQLIWVGLGSNLLVRDGGIRGAVVATHQILSAITKVNDSMIEVGAGVPCAKLARRSIGLELAGAEFFAGIPGTVGGALAMNAGAFGGETWDVVESVTTLDLAGNIHRRTSHDYEIDYRHVSRHADETSDSVLPEWFLSARIHLGAGESAESLARVKALLSRRAQTQPIQSFNAGSVFRNPPNGFAAQLIEAAGLKGLRKGGAAVSTQHANFIINEGDATSADIEWLIEAVRSQVLAHSGVELALEVRIVGEA